MEQRDKRITSIRRVLLDILVYGLLAQLIVALIFHSSWVGFNIYIFSSSPSSDFSLKWSYSSVRETIFKQVETFVYYISSFITSDKKIPNSSLAIGSARILSLNPTKLIWVNAPSRTALMAFHRLYIYLYMRLHFFYKRLCVLLVSDYFSSLGIFFFVFVVQNLLSKLRYYVLQW